MAAPLVHTLRKTRQIYATFARTLLRKKVYRTAASTYSSDARDAWKVQDSPKNNNDVADRLLHFFNECDQANLRHFIDLDEKLLDDAEVASILKRGEKGERFKDIQSLMDVLMLEEPKALQRFDRTLDALNQTLDSNFVIKGTPWITNKTLENVDKVVAIDITPRDVAWTEQTSDRTVVSLNQVRLFEDICFSHIKTDLEFDHVQYQDKAAQLVPQIPESKIYLICPTLFQSVNQNSPARCHMALMESLIITLLNMRHNVHLQGNVGKSMFRNKVYSLHTGHLAGYYGYRYSSQLGQGDWLVQRVLKNEPGPLYGLKMSGQASDAYCSRPDKDLMTKCILMSDMLWQVKDRWDKKRKW